MNVLIRLHQRLRTYILESIHCRWRDNTSLRGPVNISDRFLFHAAVIPRAWAYVRLKCTRQSDMTYFDVSSLSPLFSSLQILRRSLGKLRRPLRRYIWADARVMEPQVPVQSWRAPRRRHALWSSAPRLNSARAIASLYSALLHSDRDCFPPLFFSFSSLLRYSTTPYIIEYRRMWWL